MKQHLKIAMSVVRSRPCGNGADSEARRVGGKWEHHHAVGRQLMIDLDVIDQSLRLFKPMPPSHAACKGEVARIGCRYCRLSNGAAPALRDKHGPTRDDPTEIGELPFLA